MSKIDGNHVLHLTNNAQKVQMNAEYVYFHFILEMSQDYVQRKQIC